MSLLIHTARATKLLQTEDHCQDLQLSFPKQWRSNKDATGLVYIEEWPVEFGLLHGRNEWWFANQV